MRALSLVLLALAGGCQFAVDGLAPLAGDDAAGHDAPVVDAAAPDARLVDASDGAVVVDAQPDLAPVDATPTDSPPLDGATPDLAMPDLATPDLAKPDLAMPDLAMPDLAMPDLAMPDLAMPDLAMPDLTPDPCGNPAAPPTGTLVARCVIGAAPTIDGDLSDWDLSTFTTLKHSNTALVDQTSGWTGTAATDDANFSLQFALRWDATYVYFAATVTDDKRGITGVNAPTTGSYFREDSLELYFDGLNDRHSAYEADDHHTIITADNRAQDVQPTPRTAPTGFKSATIQAQSGGAWTLEVAYPWTALTTTASPGKLLGFDLQGNDDDNNGTTRDRELVWWNNASTSGCQHPYCDLSNVGQLQLGGR